MFINGLRVEEIVNNMGRGFDWDKLGKGKYFVVVKEYGNEGWEGICEGDMIVEYDIEDEGVKLVGEGNIREVYEEDEDSEEYSDFDIMDMWIDNNWEGGYEINIYKVP